MYIKYREIMILMIFNFFVENMEVKRELKNIFKVKRKKSIGEIDLKKIWKKLLLLDLFYKRKMLDNFLKWN